MRANGRAPLHQRLPPLAWLRSPFRHAFFRLARLAARSDDGRSVAAAALDGLLPSGEERAQGLPPLPGDYQELACLASSVPRRDDRGAVFITGRFRSGSTMLWNLFRNIDGCTAYYEPLNERRWFDPAQRGQSIDASHRGIDNYWREYEGLTELGRHYDEGWTRRHLLMRSEDWNPAMQAYIDILVRSAPGRPVLQFNRVDFRLAWLRRHFPGATILHLYRNPRDQWCSMLKDLAACPPQAAMADFAAHDRFYLLAWARDLRHHFPFLDERELAHPYQLAYLVWRLSHAFGVRDADITVSFERLAGAPQTEIPPLLASLGIPCPDPERLAALVDPPRFGRWRDYADDEWFRRHEVWCEGVLAEFFGNGSFAQTSR